jgi:hypothetical protein
MQRGFEANSASKVYDLPGGSRQLSKVKKRFTTIPDQIKKTGIFLGT